MDGNEEQRHDSVSHGNLAVLIIHLPLQWVLLSQEQQKAGLREERTSVQERTRLFSAAAVTELNIPHSHAFEVFSVNSRFKKLLCEVFQV